MLLLSCGALDADASRSPVAILQFYGSTPSFSQASRTYPVGEYRSRSAGKPKGKRDKLPYPPRRCAALIGAHTQCPGNAIEPTDYCARHQKPDSYSGPQE
jgi:hypothetical protein